VIRSCSILSLWKLLKLIFDVSELACKAILSRVCKYFYKLLPDESLVSYVASKDCSDRAFSSFFAGAIGDDSKACLIRRASFPESTNLKAPDSLSVYVITNEIVSKLLRYERSIVVRESKTRSSKEDNSFAQEILATLFEESSETFSFPMLEGVLLQDKLTDPAR
jgi:hypothetical protein